MVSTTDTLIEVKDIQVQFNTPEGVVRAVDGANFSVKRGQVVGVVGESGCGKSMTARSILNIVRPPGRVVGGQILYHRTNAETIDLMTLPPMSDEMRRIRGAEISMIFQEPRASLSPVHTVGDQIAENILLHQNVSKQEARIRTLEMLQQVHLPKPESQLDKYPHQLSGGMCQRVMIAMALSCRPNLLIADEPTTALDVTTEAQILELMQQLQNDFNMAIIFITHSLGVIAEMADEVVVMYLGREVERGRVEDIFSNPRHPYTVSLLESLPRIEQDREWLQTVRGMVPDPYTRLTGCPFHPRCDHAIAGVCDQIEPPLITMENGQQVRCVLYDPAIEKPNAPSEEVTR